MKEQLDAKDAWTNFLLSGKMPSWDSAFWSDLENLLKVRKKELPETTYAKPASEALRKRLIDQFKEMTKEDIADIWQYTKIEQEKNRYMRELADEKEKREGAEKEQRNLKEAFENRIMEEASNILGQRINTKICKNCKALF
jgi:hypothetical protein